MNYYKVTVYMEVDGSEWDSSCDETFHGPGRLHLPDQGCYVTGYTEVDQTEFNKNKYNIFDVYGGI